MRFFPPSFRRNKIVPVALAMGLLRAVLVILLVGAMLPGENVAAAEGNRRRVRTAEWTSPKEDLEESFGQEYIEQEDLGQEYVEEEEDDYVDDVEPGPSLGLMRSTGAKSRLVARKQERPPTPPLGASDENFFEEDAEPLPPANRTRKAPQRVAPRSSKSAPTPRPISPGAAISRQKYLPSAEAPYEEDQEDEDYDDPTCAAAPSQGRGDDGHGDQRDGYAEHDYPGPHLPHGPLFPPSKWRIHTSPLFAHNDPADPMRFHAWGEPLYTSSWRNRPWYISPFAGGLIGDDIQEDRIRQGGNFFAGVRLGGDFDHYFGAETRIGFSDLSLSFPAAGYTPGKSSNVAMFDGSLLYYPLGDTRWRPYFTAGLGIASFHYYDPAGNRYRSSSLTLPFGGGLKVKIRPAIALRFDIVDNFATGTGGLLDAMHNISFTGGFEWRFGGQTKNYYPW